MIINIDRRPDYSLYYIGAVILEILNEYNGITIEHLFQKVKEKIDEKLHIDFVYYALDWLYMLSLIEIDFNKVMLC